VLGQRRRIESQQHAPHARNILHAQAARLSGLKVDAKRLAAETADHKSEDGTKTDERQVLLYAFRKHRYDAALGAFESYPPAVLFFISAGTPASSAARPDWRPPH
jgi:hypothetical protein